MFNNEFLLKPYFRSVYKFDGTSWTTLPSLNVARASPALVVVNSRILVIGGISTSQAPSDKIEMFDGEKWIDGPQLPCYMSIVFDNAVMNRDGKIILLSSGQLMNTNDLNVFFND